MGHRLFFNYLSSKNKKNILLLFIILPLFLSVNITRHLNDESNQNEIRLTIEGINLEILSDKFNEIPAEVLLNDIKVNLSGRKILNEYDNIRFINNVTLRWNRTFANCSYMFYNLTNITNVDLTKFNFSKVTSTVMLFAHCKNLQTIIFPDNINITTIQNMNSMFYNCINLKSLDLSSFRTTSLGNINSLFSGCNSLTFLDLSNWDFKNVQFSKNIFNSLTFLKHFKLYKVNTHFSSMKLIFSDLKYITSLNLSNFYTFNVSNMYGMFANSTKLTNLDLTNFDTRQVQVMWFLFDGCSSLTSLDLSSFDTSKVTDFDVIFHNMLSLTYIKLNFNLNSMVYKYNTLNGTNNFQYCIIDESKMTFFYDLIRTLKNTTRDCSTKCYPDSRILNKNTNQCILFDCSKNLTHNYIYNGKCYKQCPPKTYLESNINKLCKDLYCENYYNYYQTDCINEIPEGFYLNDSNQRTIDKCHSDCRECYGKATNNNTNCKSCFSDKMLLLGNCVSNCPNGFVKDKFDSSKKICTCPNLKCLECSLESNSLNLCISCNQNYYPIFVFYNIYPYNIFYNCSNNPEGYYLDSKYLFIKNATKHVKHVLIRVMTNIIIA